MAVTTSLTNPVHDFEVNARGTLNLLEALRAQDDPPPLVFTSTNKVYGGLEDVPLRCKGRRYEPEDAGLRANGIGEAAPAGLPQPLRLLQRRRRTSTSATTPARSACPPSCSA